MSQTFYQQNNSIKFQCLYLEYDGVQMTKTDKILVPGVVAKSRENCLKGYKEYAVGELFLLNCICVCKSS